MKGKKLPSRQLGRPIVLPTIEMFSSDNSFSFQVSKLGSKVGNQAVVTVKWQNLISMIESRGFECS